MKKIIKVLLLLIVNSNLAQNNIINVYDGVAQDVPSGTYLKDTEDSFTKFLGTWKWQEGNKILIFKIEKVTQYLNTEYGVYEDFIKGNYSYTENGGVSYVVNSILQNFGNNNPNNNPIFSCGTLSQLEIRFVFKDIVYDKSNCNAIFKFLPNSTNQVELSLINTKKGYILPETPPNPDFSIPNNVILTKQ